MLKKIQSLAFVIIIFMCFNVTSSAQLFINDTLPSMNNQSPSDKQNNFHFGLSLGTGFTKSSYGSFYNTSVTPTFSYTVNPRLTIDAGVSYISFFNTGNQQTSNSETSLLIPQRTVSLFAATRYKVTDRFTVSSIVYINKSDYKPVMNAGALFPDSKGVALGFNYKLTDHASIGAEFRINQGNNFGGPMGMGPFISNPLIGY